MTLNCYARLDELATKFNLDPIIIDRATYLLSNLCEDDLPDSMDATYVNVIFRWGHYQDTYHLNLHILKDAYLLADAGGRWGEWQNANDEIKDKVLTFLINFFDLKRNSIRDL